jgi:hypothetical protein
MSVAERAYCLCTLRAAEGSHCVEACGVPHPAHADGLAKKTKPGEVTLAVRISHPAHSKEAPRVARA